MSVVVPTCNRADRMVRLIDALAAQDFGEPFEVVAVDDRSKDDTLQRLQKVAEAQPFALTVVPSEVNTGPAGARNRGWHLAKGELIAFTDDDCVPDKGWLRAMVTALDDADIAVGRTRPPDDQLHKIGPFSTYLDMEHNRTFSTCNIAYRKAVLQQLDGFDEVNYRYPNGEDTDLGLRALEAHFKDAYAPDALVWHDVGESDFKTYFRRIERLDGLVALAAIHPEAREIMNCGYFLRSIDKVVLIAWAAGLGLLVRPKSPFRWLCAVGAALLYAYWFNRAYYRARSTKEWAAAVPRGFVADSWTVFVMLRSSARHKTVLL